MIDTVLSSGRAATHHHSRVGICSRLLTAVAGAWLFAALVFSLPGAAHAQEMYDSSEPAIKEVLKQSPKTMKIVFSEGIQLKTVRLFKADKTELPLEWNKTDDDVFQVEARVPQELPPGEYELQWFAWVRQHYHSDGGVIPFTVAP